jgi:arsenical pump membrane protein
MILSLLFFPKIKLGKINLDTYYIITLIGALILIIFGKININEMKELFFNTNGMNPIKIIILFLSMAFLSIYLDKLGFFHYIANLAAMKFKKSQISLFLALFILISILTVFTSNDIIILTFTPFICYFCKNTKINPIPYLIGEFFAANTLSMTLIIGNPTNIYIASNAGITFMEYFSKMFIIGILTSVLLCLILLLLFKKQLKQPIVAIEQESNIKSKFLLIVGLIHLICCTVIMAISNYINIPMYLVSLGFAISLIIITLIYTIINNIKTKILLNSLHDLPVAFIPFLVSMVILISCLSKTEYIKELSLLLEEINSPILYGASSFFLGNLLNNIPMSILYSEIFASSTINLNAIYEVIAASNLCALFTPLGSLAGMMFLSLVKQQDIDFSFIKFIKYGFVGIILSIFSFALIMIF